MENDTEDWLKKYNRSFYKLFIRSIDSQQNMEELAGLLSRQLGNVASNISRDTGQDIGSVCSDLACEVTKHASECSLYAEPYLDKE